MMGYPYPPSPQPQPQPRLVTAEEVEALVREEVERALQSVLPSVIEGALKKNLAKIDSIEKSVASLRADVDRLKASVPDVNAVVASSIQASVYGAVSSVLENALTRLNEVVRLLNEASRSGIKIDASPLNDAINELRQVLLEAQNTVSKFNSELKNVASVIESLRKTPMAGMEDISSIRRTVEELRSSVVQLDQSLTVVQAAVRKLNDDVVDLQNTVRSLSVDTASMFDRMTNLMNAILDKLK